MQSPLYFNNSSSIPLTVEQQQYYMQQQYVQSQFQLHAQQQYQLQHQQQQQAAFAYAAQQQAHAQYLHAQAQAAKESMVAQSHMLAQQAFVYAESRRLELRAVADKARKTANDLEKTTVAPRCTCKPKCMGTCKYRHCRYFFGPDKYCRDGDACERLHLRAACVEDAYAVAAAAEAAAERATAAAAVAAADLSGLQQAAAVPVGSGNSAEPHQGLVSRTLLKPSAPEWIPASEETSSSHGILLAGAEEWADACAAVAANPLDAFLQTCGIVLDTTRIDDSASVATLEGSMHGDADESYSVRSGQ